MWEFLFFLIALNRQYKFICVDCDYAQSMWLQAAGSDPLCTYIWSSVGLLWFYVFQFGHPRAFLGLNKLIVILDPHTGN